VDCGLVAIFPFVAEKLNMASSLPGAIKDVCGNLKGIFESVKGK